MTKEAEDNVNSTDTAVGLIRNIYTFHMSSFSHLALIMFLIKGQDIFQYKTNELVLEMKHN